MVMGNINPVDVMLHGTPSEVEEARLNESGNAGPAVALFSDRAVH
jgi:hypothetical protein